MEIFVQQKNIPISPKKARLINAQIKGKSIEEALRILKFLPQKAAYYYSKILKNGRAIVEDKNLEQKNIYIKGIRIDKARSLKRIRYKPRGRADMIAKSRSHFGIILDEKITDKLKESKSTDKKAVAKIKEKKHGSKS
ncbi:MAG: uL22 family ribosomal protein [bacterium]